MIKTKFIAALAAGITCVVASSAFAQTYVGAGIGSANSNINCSGLTNCKSSDVSGSVVAGYDFLSNWGVEAAYNSLGKISGGVSGTYNQQAITATYSSKISAFDLAVIYRTDFDRDWAAFAKLGISRTSAKDTLNGTVGTSTIPTISYTDDSIVPVYGAGVIYKISEKVQLHLSIDRRKVKAYDNNGVNLSFNVNNVSVGGQYSF